MLSRDYTVVKTKTASKKDDHISVILRGTTFYIRMALKLGQLLHSLIDSIIFILMVQKIMMHLLLSRTLESMKLSFGIHLIPCVSIHIGVKKNYLSSRGLQSNAKNKINPKINSSNKLLHKI